MRSSDVVRFQAPSLPTAEEVETYFSEARDLRWFSNGGPCVSRLQRECADYLGLEHAGVAVNNATTGLVLALRACFGTPAAGRRLVAVPSFTFIATVNALKWSGFEPVFIDIDPDDWLPSESSLAELEHMRESLAGFLLCSTFGTAPSAERRRSLASSVGAYELPVIVDSAAGFGSRDEYGRRLGDQGDAEVFSFHATKPFAIGEGGLVTSTSASVLETIAQLSNFGFDSERSIPGHLGLNGKMPELTAAVGLAVLHSFDDVLERRQRSADWLRAELSSTEVAFQQGAERSAHQFVPIVMPSVESRERLFRQAPDAGIEVRAYFDPPMHRLPPFANNPSAGPLKTTEWLCERIVALPMANDIGADSLARIRDLVLGAL